ncbi:MAG: hypothetical protein ACO2PN_13670 [Pyrobaculum sp.]
MSRPGGETEDVVAQRPSFLRTAGGAWVRRLSRNLSYTDISTATYTPSNT